MESTNVEIDEPMVQSRAMTTTGGSNKQNQGETPVANINYRIYNPFPRTNQVLMHFRRYDSGSIAAAVEGVSAYTFRLNSITDCVTSIVYGADPARDTPDVNDATPNIPAMRNFWSCVYDYYTVVRSRYHFRIRWNNSTANNQDVLDIYQHMHGKQYPPLFTSANKPIPWTYRKRFPQTIMKQSLSQITGDVITGTSAASTHANDIWTDFYGEWYPGAIQHEVEEDDLKQTWTKMIETPKIGEFVTFVIQRSSTTDSVRGANWEWEFNIEFEVQLKSLRDQWQYIRPGITLSMDPVDIATPALSITAAQVYNQLEPNSGI